MVALIQSKNHAANKGKTAPFGLLLRSVTAYHKGIGLRYSHYYPRILLLLLSEVEIDYLCLTDLQARYIDTIFNL